MITPEEFVNKWNRSELRERASSQEHFIDICHLLDHPTPAESDPKGTIFTFEYGATKLTGGQGWADVWKKDYFGWEYKGKKKDLDAAYIQLLQYRESLLNPPLLIVSDINKIIIHTNFTNSIARQYIIDNTDLLNPDSRKILWNAFYNPIALYEPISSKKVTEEAASQFASLARKLEEWGDDPQIIAHFLIQILFCLFAEDINLLPNKIFTRLISQQYKKTDELVTPMKSLFNAMAKGDWFGEIHIKLINGGLFNNARILELPSDAIDILINVSSLNWSKIEPSIFGTLFERSLDPTKRSQLGAHYTSRDDILLIVEPVVMKPLRDYWKILKNRILEKVDLDLENISIEQKKEIVELKKDIHIFAEKISNLQVLDPACGSGNFLYVALISLLDLEKEVISTAKMVNIDDILPKVSPSQLHGIEINTYAHELAEATIWIGFIQWMYENGYGLPTEPILKNIDSIKNIDAILSLNNGIASSIPEWPISDVIIGNPPYLGSRKMRPVLGEKYCDELIDLYKEDIKGMPDLVCYWFEIANNLVKSGKAKRVGLLATQAIRGGTNRQVLDNIKKKGDIFLAWSDREWVLDGATVHVSFIGFDNGSEKDKILNGLRVREINSDLTSTTNLSIAKALIENEGIAFQGEVLRGKFNISETKANNMILSSGNPNGKSNLLVIKPRRTGKDIVGKCSNEYVIDFGLDMTLEDASQFEEPYKYIKSIVYPQRIKAKQKEARTKWWIHWNTRKELRERIKGLNRYIATPRVSKHRIFVWLGSEIFPDAQLVIFARNDDYFFGVLQSKVHEIWSRRKGTQLRDAVSGFRYTHKSVFNTFPFPWKPGSEPIESEIYMDISNAAESLVDKRNYWLSPNEEELIKKKNIRTLTALYNENPDWLQFENNKLNNAVYRAYGWRSDITDEEILFNLLLLNQQRAI